MIDDVGGAGGGLRRQDAAQAVPKVAGIAVLKGLVLYAAIFTFAGLYVSFIVAISGASAGTKPVLDAVLVSAAAALAGVLGSAFALEVGTTTSPAAANAHLAEKLEAESPAPWTRVYQALSFDAGGSDHASIPKTVGIWVYAIVGAAMAVTYVLNQAETPDAVKALAVAFAGYVLALVTAAYQNNG